MPSFRRRSRHALTLAEMLVVLVILSVVALIAVQSLAPVVEQARYDATKKTLAEIRKAIVGDPSIDAAVTGFVGDMGRLPAADLSDLLIQPPDAPILEPGNQPFHGIFRTWRGPYLRPLANGAAPLVDGWGKPVSLIPHPALPNAVAIMRGAADEGDVLAGFDGPILETILRSEWTPRSVKVHLSAFANGVSTTPKATRVVVYAPGLSVDGAIEFAKSTPLGSDNNGATYEIPLSTVTPAGEQYLSCGQRVVCVFDASDNSLLVTRFVLIRPNADHLIELQVAAQSSQQPTTPPTIP